MQGAAEQWMLQLVLKMKSTSLHWLGLAPLHWQRRTDCVWLWLPDEPKTTVIIIRKMGKNIFFKYQMKSHRTIGHIRR